MKDLLGIYSALSAFSVVKYGSELKKAACLFRSMPQAGGGEEMVEIARGHLHEGFGVAAAVLVLEGAVDVQAEGGGGVVVVGGLAGEDGDGLAFEVGTGGDVDAAVGEGGGPDFVAAED